MQVERKRHLGNDVVLLVFRDGPFTTPFRPSAIRSQFNRTRLFCDNNRLTLVAVGNEDVYLVVTPDYARMAKHGPGKYYRYILQYMKGHLWRDVLGWRLAPSKV